MVNNRAHASSKPSCTRCPYGRSSGIWVGAVPSSTVLVRGLVNGFRMALSWAPRVLVSFRQVPHAVAALLQLQMPPVVLLVVVKGFGAVRVGSINHAEGVAAQLNRAQDGAYWVSSCSAVSHRVGCKPGRVSLCMARSTICTFYY